MAIKAAGSPLSLSEIQAEFGGSNPISLSEYYRGGGLVPNGPTQNNGIAASGAISLGGFYGSVRAFVFNQTIASNTNNYNLRNAAIAAGWDQATPLQATVTINSGVVVSSPTTATAAFDTGTAPAGSSISIVNNGYIVGMGGNAGSPSGRNNATIVPGSAGGSGGPALRAQTAINVTNNGVIAGGGGGGGGGRAFYYIVDDKYGGQAWMYRSGGSGGGRTGLTNTAATGPSPSAGHNNPAGGTIYAAVSGGGGTFNGAGGGGRGDGVNSSMDGAVGAGGGDWGAAGGTGGAGGSGIQSYTSTGGPYGGGAGGAAVVGNGNINWVATGTRYGALT